MSRTDNNPALINVGTGKDVSIKDLAEIIKTMVGFEGKVVWDASKPDGTPRRRLDVERMHSLGWSAKTDFEAGLRASYQWFVENYREATA